MRKPNHKYTQQAQAEGSKWRVFVSPSTNYGYFEHEVMGEGGSLSFEGNMLVDYDGVYELPKNVIKALRLLDKTFDRFIIPE